MKQTLISNFLDEEDFFPPHLNYSSTLAYISFAKYFSGSLRVFSPHNSKDAVFVKKWLQLLGLGKTYNKLSGRVEKEEGKDAAKEFASISLDMLIDCYTLVKAPNSETYLNEEGQKESAAAVRKFLYSYRAKTISYVQLTALIDLIRAVNLKLDQYAYKFLLKHEHNT